MIAKRIKPEIIKALYGLFLGLMLTGLLGPFPNNVRAACSGAGCIGKDPNNEGCTSNSTLQRAKPPTELGFGEAWVELRRSSSCNAKWTRTINKSSGGASAYAAATSWWPPVAYPPNLNYSRSSASPIAYDSSVYTNMLGPAYEVKACGKNKWGASSIPVPIDRVSPYCTIYN